MFRKYQSHEYQRFSKVTKKGKKIAYLKTNHQPPAKTWILIKYKKIIKKRVKATKYNSKNGY